MNNNNSIDLGNIELYHAYEPTSNMSGQTNVPAHPVVEVTKKCPEGQLPGYSGKCYNAPFSTK